MAEKSIWDNFLHFGEIGEFRLIAGSEDCIVLRVENDTRLVENVLEYIQGISEVKSYGLTGKSKKKLEESIAEASHMNTALEMAANRYIPVQNVIMKLTGVAILLFSIRFYLAGTMDHRGAYDGDGLPRLCRAGNNGLLFRTSAHCRHLRDERSGNP